MRLDHIDSPNFYRAVKYATSIVSGKIIAAKRRRLACERFLKDLESSKWDFRQQEFDFVIKLIQTTIVHKKGESLDGVPLSGTPFILQEWQVFLIVNLFGFYNKDSRIRRFNELLLMLPRKNGKTPFATALAWAISLLENKSGATCYVLANNLKQTKESFEFIKYNVERYKDPKIRIRDNNNEHSISKRFSNGGYFEFNALAAKEDNLDSFNGNVIVLDEVHGFKNAKKYTLMKNAQRAFRNKLLMAITTAGDLPNGFLAQRLKYCDKVLNGTVEDDAYLIFICDCDVDDNGEVVNYTDENVLIQANPSIGITVDLNDLKRDAEMAVADPQTRNEYFNKTLNLFTNSIKAYFNILDFTNSDKQYDWTLEELVKLPITWYGGADLSKLHDLTAAALYGRYNDVDIAITHAFFPITAAHKKANEDGIPLFGWRDDGWLTMSNTETVLYDDIINWFVSMRKKGFKIKIVGFDKKFGREFYLGMQKQRFKIVDQPQYFYRKSEGFRRIEVKAKNREFYYLHSDAFEYCVQNVRAVEKTDDMIQYSKVDEGGKYRIDIFDATVFAAVQMLEDLESEKDISGFFKKKGEK